MFWCLDFPRRICGKLLIIMCADVKQARETKKQQLKHKFKGMRRSTERR